MVTEASQPTLWVAIDFGVAVLAAALAYCWPQAGASWFGRIERHFAALASKKWLAAIAVGLSLILLRIAILPIFGIPNPFSPDDFSFLLAADTFTHGRLANPTPTLWTHFETLHVTMVPTYQSMYFPGQGLLMAASQVFFGHPWWGVLISSALMCAALTWALQAWVPANWALLGGFIAVLRIGMLSYWTNMYFAAGSLCALGGALVLGSLPRLKRAGSMRYGLTMATGISILVVTRPYEGLLLCVPVAGALLHWIWKGKSRPPLMVLARRAALPLALVATSIAWLGYYDLKAFGKATTLPYTLDRAQYATAPYFVWQHERPAPHYRFARMQEFYQEHETAGFKAIHSWKGYLPATLSKVTFTLWFFTGVVLLSPLLMVRRVLLDRRVRFLIICMAVLAAGVLVEVFLQPHYVAAFLVVFYALGMQAMRHLRLWKPEGRSVGRSMVRLAVLSCVVLAALRVAAKPLHLDTPGLPPGNANMSWYGVEIYGQKRAEVEARLENLPGPQLAIVQYEPGHNPGDEWVYNAADIGSSKVIWAREMDDDENLELIHQYQGRTVWLVEPNADPVQVSPYPGTQNAAKQ